MNLDDHERRIAALENIPVVKSFLEFVASREQPLIDAARKQAESMREWISEADIMRAYTASPVECGFRKKILSVLDFVNARIGEIVAAAVQEAPPRYEILEVEPSDVQMARFKESYSSTRTPPEPYSRDIAKHLNERLRERGKTIGAIEHDERIRQEAASRPAREWPKFTTEMAKEFWYSKWTSTTKFDEIADCINAVAARHFASSPKPAAASGRPWTGLVLLTLVPSWYSLPGSEKLDRLAAALNAIGCHDPRPGGEAARPAGQVVVTEEDVMAWRKWFSEGWRLETPTDTNSAEWWTARINQKLNAASGRPWTAESLHTLPTEPLHHFAGRDDYELVLKKLSRALNAIGIHDTRPDWEAPNAT